MDTSKLLLHDNYFVCELCRQMINQKDGVKVIIQAYYSHRTSLGSERITLCKHCVKTVGEKYFELKVLNEINEIN